MVLLAAAVVLLILAIFAFDTSLMVRKYSIEAEEIETPIYTVVLGFLTSDETTDIRYYTRAYEVIEDEDGVKGIFPKKIPADAKNIEFSYMPQVLQGGEVFELSYTTTEEKLTEWKTVLTRETEWIGSNKEWHEANHWGCTQSQNSGTICTVADEAMLSSTSPEMSSCLCRWDSLFLMCSAKQIPSDTV